MSSASPAIELAKPASPFTVRLAYRFVWKECRRLFGLALGATGIALAVMLGLAQWASAGGPVQMMIVAFGGTAMFAIAASITLFAVEKEEGTAALLRTLPLNYASMMLGKVAAAVLSVMVVLLVLLILAYAVAGGWPEATTSRLILSQGTIVLAEALAFGILASLICPYPLVAAVLGMVLASLNSQVAIMLFARHYQAYGVDAWQEVLAVRWGFVALATAMNWWLGRKWLAVDSRTRSRAWRFSRVRAAVPTASRTGWLAAFTRLVWQSVRQSMLVAVMVFGLGICLTIAFDLVFWMFTDKARSWRPVALAGVLFTPAQLGAMVFRADQRQRQYRFLSEHAGRPYVLWLARVLTWLVPTMLLAATICLAASYFAINALQEDYRWIWHHSNQMDGMGLSNVMAILMGTSHSFHEALRYAAIFCSAVFTAFAYGQFLSIAIRSETLAAMAAIILSTVIALWTFVVALSGLSALLFLVPLGVGALLASLLRVKDWMFDRQGFWRWCLPTAALLLPIAMVLAAAPGARNAQLADFPKWKRSGGGTVVLANPFDRQQDYLDVAEQEQKLGRKVADAYQRLASKVDKESQGWSLSQEEIDRIIDLSNEQCRLPKVMGPLGEQRVVVEGLQFALLNQVKVESAEDLDQRLDHLLACRRLAAQQSNGSGLTNVLRPTLLSSEILEWATAEGQTSERILTAIDKLQAIELRVLGPSGRLANEQLRVLSVVRGDVAPSFFNRRKVDGTSLVTFDEWLAYVANQLPGEQERAERAQLILAAFWTEYFQVFEFHIASRRQLTENEAFAWRQQIQSGVLANAATMMASTQISQFRRWALQQRMQLMRHARTSYLVEKEFNRTSRFSQSLREWLDMVGMWRAEKVRLALIAYRIDHGDYPEKLSDLSPDYMDAWEYRDLYGASPFGYSREGFAHPTSESTGGHPAGTPLLWSIGVGEAKPVVAYARYEDEEGERVETVYRVGSPEIVNRGLTNKVMILQHKLSTWAPGAFWLPLPVSSND